MVGDSDSAAALRVVSALRPLAPLMDALPDGVAVVDESGVIGFVNAQLAELSGYSSDELIGAAVEMLVPERARAQHVRHRRGFLKNASARPMGAGLSTWLLRHDRTEVPVDIALSPLPGETGSVVVSIRDRTERLSLEESARRLDLIEERDRIAHRLSASIVHDLFELGLAIQLARVSLNPEAGPLGVRFDEWIATTDRIIVALRNLVFEKDVPTGTHSG